MALALLATACSAGHATARLPTPSPIHAFGPAAHQDPSCARPKMVVPCAQITVAGRNLVEPLTLPDDKHILSIVVDTIGNRPRYRSRLVVDGSALGVLEAADVSVVGSGFARTARKGLSRQYEGRSAVYRGVVLRLVATDSAPGTTTLSAELVGKAVP